MTLFIKRAVIFIVIFETILFYVLYCFGPNGIHIRSSLQIQKDQVVQDIMNLEQDIEKLQQEIQESKTDFSKEKIAREKLLMKKDNEMIFFTKK